MRRYTEAGVSGDRSLVPLVDRLVDQRFQHAALVAESVRTSNPTAPPDVLADRIINRYTRELMMGGALTGGAAAAPVAGIAVAAATAGADMTYSMGKLSEMIMAIGMVYDADPATAEERSTWIWAVLGVADGATAGVTGIAARLGAQGGSRLLAKLPTGAKAAANASLSRRAVRKLTTGRGPWSLAALVPYGIGAGVGAGGNVLLARSVGRAAKQFFSTRTEVAGGVAGPFDGSLDGVDRAPPADRWYDIIDAEIVDAEVEEGEIVDDGPGA